MMFIDEAYRYCRNKALKHYENFPVATLLIPKKFRKHIYAVYSFARYADDIADNPDLTEKEKIALLNECDEMLIEPGNDLIFCALNDTIKKFNLPLEEFKKLLKAFRQDVNRQKYETINELLEYSSCSANPIGRILLKIYGIRNYESAEQYSDYICTALQLINFLQDVSVDLKFGRIYIPGETIRKFGYSYENLIAQNENIEYAALIKHLTDYTKELINKGKKLIGFVKGRFRYELKLIIKGGEMILKKIESMEYKTLTRRPALSFFDKINVLFFTIMK